jgi:hypothetical protein
MTRCGPVVLALPATSTYQVINHNHRLQTRIRLRVQGQREVGIGFDLDNLAFAAAERAEPIIVLHCANTSRACCGRMRAQTPWLPTQLVATGLTVHVEASWWLIWYNS